MTEFSEAKRELIEAISAAPRRLQAVACWISFGGNVGDVKATFDAALALLSLHCHIQLGQRSSVYCTSPVGTHSGSPFLNSVCGLTTQLSPNELLAVLQSVETQLGRVRDLRWGPRTLDLDLLSYGDQLLFEPDLIVPHPALTYRRFVLDPLVEIDPHWSHPGLAQSASQLLWRLSCRPLRVQLLDVLPEDVEVLSAQLAPRFPHLEFVDREAHCDNGLAIRTKSRTDNCKKTVVNLCHSPGDLLEQLTSAFTAIFDAPQRISAW